MEDYPRTLSEFDNLFGTEDACFKYLLQVRWPNGFICPRCQETKAWHRNRGLMVCASCGYEVSVTAGTIFESTHKHILNSFAERIFDYTFFTLINTGSAKDAF